MNINNILTELDDLIKEHSLGECGDYGDGFRDGLYMAKTIILSVMEENNESRESSGYG